MVQILQLFESLRNKECFVFVDLTTVSQFYFIDTFDQYDVLNSIVLECTCLNLHCPLSLAPIFTLLGFIDCLSYTKSPSVSARRVLAFTSIMELSLLLSLVWAQLFFSPLAQLHFLESNVSSCKKPLLTLSSSDSEPLSLPPVELGSLSSVASPTSEALV